MKKIPHPKALNVAKVPLEHWNKWSVVEQSVFNAVYLAMKADQETFLHPQTTPTSAERWKTTAYNAAWIAAEAAQRENEKTMELQARAMAEFMKTQPKIRPQMIDNYPIAKVLMDRITPVGLRTLIAKSTKTKRVRRQA